MSISDNFVFLFDNLIYKSANIIEIVNENSKFSFPLYNKIEIDGKNDKKYILRSLL
jgi:hypothetical protein